MESRFFVSLGLWFPLALVGFLPTTRADTREKMNFSAVRLGVFEKSACSPQITGDGIALAAPDRIGWGDPLPVCGAVRPKEAYARAPVRVSVRIAFEKPIASNSELSGLLFEHAPVGAGPLYFSFDAFKPLGWSTLPPGRYRVTAQSSEIESPARGFRILPSGWRKAYCDALAEHFCRRNLVQDLSRYLGALHLASIESYRSVEDHEHVRKELRRLWVSGFVKHRSLLTPEIRTGLLAIKGDFPSLDTYLLGLVSARCPRRSEAERRGLQSVLGGIAQYEFEE
jgi:hypothetical protein